MYKKIVLIFSCFILIGNLSFAQNSAFCKAAKDSMKAQFARGEMGCYVTGKLQSNAVLYLKMFNTHYEKVSVKYGAKDTTLQKKYAAMIEKAGKAGKEVSKNDTGEIKKSAAVKFNPNDTSSEFKRCYNQAFQLKLDSAFKCDFFRKSDSIIKSYDKQGKGYKSVDFLGGAGALQKFMDKNVTLPKDAKPSDSDNVIRVYYSFLVDEKGATSEVKLAKSNCKACEDAVLAALQKLPAFIPATEAGKPKKVKYILPYTKKI